MYVIFYIANVDDSSYKNQKHIIIHLCTYIIKYSSTYLIVGIGRKSYGFWKFCALKTNLAIDFIRKNPLECIGWANCNDAVSWLNEVKTRIFWPTANFENFEINLYFIYLPACLL